jgi:hypothetical protein
MSSAKKPTVKKTLAQKKSAPAKKVAKKTAAKKVTKTLTKKSKVATKKTAVAKKTAAPKKKDSVKKTAKSTNKTTQVEAGVVVVPTNIPLRSVEKAEVLRTELSMAWQKSLYSIAYVSGACFIIIGTTFAGSSVLVGATINNSALVSQSNITDSTSVLQVQNPLPDVLSEQTKVLFTLTNVEPASVVYYLVNQETRQVSDSKKVSSLLNDKFSFTIDSNELNPGRYKLQVEYVGLNTLLKNETKKTEVIGAFVVKEIVEKPTSVKVPEDISSSSTVDVFTTSIIENPEGAIKLSDSDEIVKVPVKPEVTDISDAGSDAVDESKRSEVFATNEDTIDTTAKALVPLEETNGVELQTQDADKFSLYSKDSVISGLMILNSIKSDGLTNLQLYARPSASLNSRFLVKETQRSGARVFVVNTQSYLPNGVYEFYAKGTNETGKEIITRSLVLEIKNELATPVVQQTDSLKEVLDMETESTARDFAPVNFADTENKNLDAEINLAGEKLLKDNFAEVNSLLKNYSTARQSGDLILLSAARDELNAKKVELANQALLNKELAGISDDVILDISQRMTNLQARIDTFEQLRTERSAGESSIDSDKDGVSDYDEVNLYRTNPNEPDTDGDGFVDGIEIVRGFDPLDAAPEVIVNYESPKDSVGLVNEDALSIKEVIPVVDSTEDTQKPVIFTEIRGRGLPNSFVTLYIFSSPTIVTIKTDADGSFVYTLDKELEDGSHDVFVTLTDNAGAIMAQSKSFSFVKEAQAFTPVDAAAGASVSADTATESALENSYNTVIGLSVLALGLILIMLGLTLRTKEEDELNETEKQPRTRDADPKVEPAKFA